MDDARGRRRRPRVIVKNFKSTCAWTSAPPIPPTMSGMGDQPIPAVLGGADAFSSEGALILAAKEGALAPGLADNDRWIMRKTVTGCRRSGARPEEKSQAGASTQARGGTGHTSP